VRRKDKAKHLKLTYLNVDQICRDRTIVKAPVTRFYINNILNQLNMDLVSFSGIQQSSILRQNGNYTNRYLNEKLEPGKESSSKKSDEQLMQLTVHVDTYIFLLSTDGESEESDYCSKVDEPAQVDDVISNEQFVTMDRFTNMGYAPEVLVYKNVEMTEYHHVRLVPNFKFDAALLETTVYKSK